MAPASTHVYHATPMLASAKMVAMPWEKNAHPHFSSASVCPLRGHMAPPQLCQQLHSLCVQDKRHCSGISWTSKGDQ
jgi:hypothetical protein